MGLAIVTLRGELSYTSGAKILSTAFSSDRLSNVLLYPCLFIWSLIYFLSLFHSCCGFPSFHFLFFFTVVEMMSLVPMDTVVDRAAYSVRTYMDGVNGLVHFRCP